MLDLKEFNSSTQCDLATTDNPIPHLESFPLSGIFSSISKDYRDGCGGPGVVAIANSPAD